MLQHAFDEGKRLLDAQLSELDGIRQRTVQFLSFVGTACAFLVGAGLNSPTRDLRFTLLAILGATLFLVALYLAFCVLRGGNPMVRWGAPLDWTFRTQPGKLMSYLGYDIGRPDEAGFLDDLIGKYQDYAETNEANLHVLRRTYWGYLMIMSTQLALWISLVVIYR